MAAKPGEGVGARGWSAGHWVLSVDGGHGCWCLGQATRGLGPHAEVIRAQEDEPDVAGKTFATLTLDSP